MSKMEKMIKTKRLTIRPVQVGDETEIHEYAGDKEITMMFWLPNDTFEETADFVKRNAEEWNQPDQTNFEFVIIYDGKIIGGCDCDLGHSEDHSYATLGWIINKKYRKQGFASEAAAAVLDFAFTKTGINKVYAQCDCNNPASFGVMKKIGMKLVDDKGTRTYPKTGKTSGEFTCLITRQEWEKIMSDKKNYVKDNSLIWDKRAENNDRWSTVVTADEVAKARKGDWHIILTPEKPVPRSWFPDDMAGKKILCLASGGGQQGPILAATGADVTVFDNSNGQLEKDKFVAQRDGLEIKTVQGNMQDLSVFENESFDLIVHPWSNNYIDDILPVWRECSRVLKKGGVLIAGFGSPLEYIFDLEKFEKGQLELKYSIPYADIDHLDDPKVREITQAEGYSWGHPIEDQIQGQISAGFVIAGFYEDRGCWMFDKHINTSMATKAIKM